MSSNKPPSNFWEAAFSPSRDFITVFILVLFAVGLSGNLFYSLLTGQISLTDIGAIVTIIVIVFCSLIACFIWENRQITQIPFNIRESDKLQRVQVVVATPSNVNAIGKIVRYHDGILQHLWLVGDSSQNDNYTQCKQNYETDILKLHRIEIENSENTENIYESYKKAVGEAIALGISVDQIVIDITGGTKLISIAAFISALEKGLKVSYVYSDYSQTKGSEEIKRTGGEFAIIEFDISSFPLDIIYSKNQD